MTRSPQPPLMQQAVVAFGQEQAAGVFSELLKRFGPVLAEMLLRWILGQQANTPAPAAAMMSPETLWAWVVSLIRSHRDEIVTMLRDRVEELVDLLLALLDGETPQPA